MHDERTTVAQLKSTVKIFIEERDWMQYHTAKNLVMAISVEANELMDHFQWLTPEEAENYMQGPKRQEVIHELADVVFGILGFCDAYNIDLSATLEEKLKLVAEKYPKK